ncbi:MAG: dTDP-4-dehydrorhamnose 3,5-epimerase family protein [Vicinamibacterales bacterium]
MKLTLDDFVADGPTAHLITPARHLETDSQIEGVSLTLLSFGSDGRGALNELLTLRNGLTEPIVHVYQIHAAPKSVRAWIYHKHHIDRLAFTDGHFRVVLYDLRPDSATFHQLNVFDLGEERRCLVRIPPFVAHGVQNRGSRYASFVNMPTSVYDASRPDKWRLSPDHPAAPYRFTDD